MVEDGKPVLDNAISERTRQRTVTAVLDNPARSEPRAGGEAAGGGRIETTQEELAAYEVIRSLLGPPRLVGCGVTGLCPRVETSGLEARAT